MANDARVKITVQWGGAKCTGAKQNCGACPRPALHVRYIKKTAFLTAEMTLNILHIRYATTNTVPNKSIRGERERDRFLFKSHMDKLTYGIRIDERYHFLMTKYRITS